MGPAHEDDPLGVDERDSIVSTPDCLAGIEQLGFDAFDTRSDWPSRYHPVVTEDARRRVAALLASLSR